MVQLCAFKAFMIMHSNAFNSRSNLTQISFVVVELEPENGAISKEVELSMIVAALVLVMAIPAFKN